MVWAAAENTGAQHTIKATTARRVGIRYHPVRRSIATFKALLAGGGTAATIKISEHLLSERDLGERRQQDDFGARILRPEDQHLGLKTSDVARWHVDDADNQATDEVSLGIAGNLRTRPFLAERAEVDLDLVGGVSRPLERLDSDDTADAQVDLGEVVVDDRRLVHQAFSAS